MNAISQKTEVDFNAGMVTTEGPLKCETKNSIILKYFHFPCEVLYWCRARSVEDYIPSMTEWVG
jgi:hypothetical protein